MPLKSMKKTEEEKKEEASPSVMDRPSYPYGLKLHIDEDSYEKLGMADVPSVGDKFMILAKVEVTDVHQAEKGDDRKYPSVGLQITDMAIKEKDEEKVKDAGQVLYGASEG